MNEFVLVIGYRRIVSILTIIRIMVASIMSRKGEFIASLSKASKGCLVSTAPSA